MADRTDGRAYASVASVCRRRLSVTLCIVAKRRVLEQKLPLTAYRKTYTRIDWPLFRGRIKVMPTIASHSPSNISETVRDKGLVPNDHQYEMAYGLSNGHMIDDVTQHQKVKLVTTIRLEHNISKTAGDVI